MDKQQLETRTKDFSIQLIRFLSKLPRNNITAILTTQLLKSGTSIGANYREANRSTSKADFIHKISIVEKEASETSYWLELLLDTGLDSSQECKDLLTESKELLAIFTSIGKTSKSRYR